MKSGHKRHERKTTARRENEGGEGRGGRVDNFHLTLREQPIFSNRCVITTISSKRETGSGDD